MNINTKELCKQIKKCRSFFWTLKDGIHYLTNRHWLVTFETLPREVLIQLFSKFAQIPEDGKTLNYSWDYDVLVQEAISFSKILDVPSESVVGEVTAFVKIYDPSHMRVINFGKYVSYVNNDYLKIVQYTENSGPKGSGPMSPISFNENTFILLPYRTAGEKDKGLLLELLEANEAVGG